MMIYDTVCNTDRAKIAPLIKLEIAHYIRQIDLHVEAANNGIAYTTVPGLAVTADRIKKDLRGVRERLASLQNSLKP